MTGHVPSPVPPPRAKLAGTPPAVRRLWSLLYRAVRRHAVRVDALDERVAALDAVYLTLLEDQHGLDRRVVLLENRIYILEQEVTNGGPP